MPKSYILPIPTQQTRVNNPDAYTEIFAQLRVCLDDFEQQLCNMPQHTSALHRTTHIKSNHQNNHDHTKVLKMYQFREHEKNKELDEICIKNGDYLYASKDQSIAFNAPVTFMTDSKVGITSCVRKNDDTVFTGAEKLTYLFSSKNSLPVKKDHDGSHMAHTITLTADKDMQGGLMVKVIMFDEAEVKYIKSDGSVENLYKTNFYDDCASKIAAQNKKCAESPWFKLLEFSKQDIKAGDKMEFNNILVADGGFDFEVTELNPQVEELSE